MTILTFLERTDIFLKNNKFETILEHRLFYLCNFNGLFLSFSEFTLDVI